jgi:hypothetical protein
VAKKKVTKKAVMGRPQKEIDKKEFEKHCFIQCTIEEMCFLFDCDDKTLNDWCKRTYKMTFSEIFAIKRQGGRISLRRKGWNMALDEKKPNTAMAIFLMKNHLDMSDTQKIEFEEAFKGFGFNIKRKPKIKD